MNDRIYGIIRKILFWVSFLVFAVLAPTLVFYSLGYKFNFQSNGFQRTGAISVRSTPENAAVFINGRRLDETTPHIIRDLLPNTYLLRVEKDDYYPYQLPVRVDSARVAEVQAVLIPKIRQIEKLAVDFEVVNFFVLNRLFGKAVFLFSDHALYLLNEDFQQPRKIVDLPLEPELGRKVKGVLEGRHQFVFWTPEKIWLVRMPAFQENFVTHVADLYAGKESIENVFFGLDERYLLIRDGEKILALDVREPKVNFDLMELKDAAARIFYDSGADVLYWQDRDPEQTGLELMKMDLTELVHETSGD